MSSKRTLFFLNEHLEAEGLEKATLSSLISVVTRFNPRIILVEKQKQGSSDPNTPWARARKLSVKQLLIRLGLMSHFPEGVKGPVERRFNRETLGELEIEQIGWWDETHHKCLIGGIAGGNGGKDFRFFFKRNENAFENAAMPGLF